MNFQKLVRKRPAKISFRYRKGEKKEDVEKNTSGHVVAWKFWRCAKKKGRPQLGQIKEEEYSKCE